MDERRPRGSLVGPVILIGLGVVFLLSNLEILPWGVWEVILRLWPVLLVAVGLDLIVGRRSLLGSLLSLVLTLALVVGALWLLWTGFGIGQELTAEEISQALEGATQAEVVIAPAAGRLHIEALQDSGSLVAGVVHLSSSEKLARDYEVEEDGRAVFALRSEGLGVPSVGGWGDEWGWDLGFHPDVPLELEIDLGAGQSNVDLTGLTVSDLEVSTGVGQTTIILPDEGDFQAEISGAIGEIVVLIPTDLAIRVRTSTGLVGSKLSGEFQRHGDVYTSPGYESAQNRVDLDVSLAIGGVKIYPSE
jgi:hypothetical protein